MRRICPYCSANEEECLGPGGRCRYFIAIFFAAIYTGFAVSYFAYCFPNLGELYPESARAHRAFSVFVLPWPWVIVAVLHFMDPGEVTPDNVESYLESYPYDGVLYARRICPTQKIPIPARSRYCRYTHKRVAYFLFTNVQTI
jgi:hypothetical protein